MIHWNRNHVQMGHSKRFAKRNGDVFHHWTIVVLQIRKARVNVPVENVAFEEPDDFLSRVDTHRLLQTRVKIVYKDRETRDVVHVRMRYDDVSDFGVLLRVQSDSDTAGVN